MCFGGGVYLRRRSQERARELMEQELADMIVRQRGVKHEILQARRMEDMNGTALEAKAITNATRNVRT